MTFGRRSRSRGDRVDLAGTGGGGRPPPKHDQPAEVNGWTPRIEETINDFTTTSYPSLREHTVSLTRRVDGSRFRGRA